MGEEQRPQKTKCCAWDAPRKSPPHPVGISRGGACLVHHGRQREPGAIQPAVYVPMASLRLVKHWVQGFSQGGGDTLFSSQSSQPGVSISSLKKRLTGPQLGLGFDPPPPGSITHRPQGFAKSTGKKIMPTKWMSLNNMGRSRTMLH